MKNHWVLYMDHGPSLGHGYANEIVLRQGTWRQKPGHAQWLWEESTLPWEENYLQLELGKISQVIADLP